MASTPDQDDWDIFVNEHMDDLDTLDMVSTRPRVATISTRWLTLRSRSKRTLPSWI